MSALVSVITATYNRWDLLTGRCIPSVQAQTYDHIEHIVVHDGPTDFSKELPPTVKYYELGKNYADWGVTPRLAGTQAARGDYIAYLDDDNEYYPEHIEALVEALESSDADIAFARQQRDAFGGTLGDGIIEHAHIDTSMVLHRYQILRTIANWEPLGYASDWELFRKWRDAGLKFQFVDKVTMRYY